MEEFLFNSVVLTFAGCARVYKSRFDVVHFRSRAFWDFEKVE